MGIRLAARRVLGIDSAGQDEISDEERALLMRNKAYCARSERELRPMAVW